MQGQLHASLSAHLLARYRIHLLFQPTPPTRVPVECAVRRCLWTVSCKRRHGAARLRSHHRQI